MFNYIKGEVAAAANGIVVIDCNGVGYELTVSQTTLVKVHNQKTAKLFAYLQVREDGMTLFGFSDIEEKTVFLKLISISGVGPKAAMSILSGITYGQLATAIVTKDVKLLSKVKGIGKKTAERIVLELSESLSKEMSLEELDLPQTEDFDRDTQDAVLALRSLGVTQQDAVKAINKAKPMAKSLEELIAFALKYI